MCGLILWLESGILKAHQELPRPVSVSPPGCCLGDWVVGRERSPMEGALTTVFVSCSVRMESLLVEREG